MAQQKNWFDDDNGATANSGSGVLAGNADASTANGQTTGAATGSGFDNLSKYLDANKGQGVDMANTLTNGLNDQANQNVNTANTWANQQKSAADGGVYQDNSKNLLNTMSNDGSAYAQKSAANDAWANSHSEADNNWANPAGYYQTINANGQDKQNMADKNQAGYKSTYAADSSKAAYSGPSGAGNYQNILDSYQKTSKDAENLAGDRNTQKDTLQQNAGLLGSKGPYTNGMSNLDSFILNGDEASANKLKDNAANIKNMNSVDSFNQKKDDVNNYIGSAQAKGVANKQAYSQNLNNQYNALGGNPHDSANAAYQYNALGSLLNRYGR